MGGRAVVDRKVFGVSARVAAALVALVLGVVLCSAPGAQAAKSKSGKVDVAGAWYMVTEYVPTVYQNEELEAYNDGQLVGFEQLLKGHLRGSTAPRGEGYTSGDGNLEGTISGGSLGFTVTYYPINDPNQFENITYTGSVSSNEQAISGTFIFISEYKPCLTERERIEWEVEDHRSCRPEVEERSGTWTATRQTREPSEEERIEKREEREAKEAEKDPTVTSVEDVSTGSNEGSFLGGETLRIKGEGFKVPEGETPEVSFYLNGTYEMSEEATEISESEIEVKTPVNLDFLSSGAPEGDHALPLDVRVSYDVEEETEEGGRELLELTSPVSSGDIYEAHLPEVDSVTDSSTGTHRGPLDGGGDTLTLDGSGFIAPQGATATVSFMDEGETLGEPVQATIVSPTEIQVPAPDLSEYESRLVAGEETLNTDAIVTITYPSLQNDEVQSRAQRRGEYAEGETGDLYEAGSADTPVVSSVTDEGDGNDQGSIFGGETLKIDGSDFEVPEGGKAEVEFDWDGDPLGQPVDVSPDSSSEIEVTAPDFASFDSRVAAGQDDLPIDVRVIIVNSTDEAAESDVSAGDRYDADVPVVSSVVDEQTASASGSILGGDTLVVKGSGFEVPQGGSASVSFLGGGQKSLSEVMVTPVSATEIRLTAPDLSAFAAQAEEGVLATEVVVTISEGAEHVSSMPAGEESRDVYFADAPYVDSVTDEESGDAQGSAIGGDTLDVEGAGFRVPAGGSATVSFLEGETKKVLSEVDATPLSATELEVSSPDLSKDADDAELGELGVVVEVTISDGTGEVKSSHEEEASRDVFDAEFPVIDSVVDETTGAARGSILGGDVVQLKGVGLIAPQGASETVKAVDSHGTTLAEVQDAPVSASEMLVESPDLTAFVTAAVEGKLAVKFVVSISKGGSEVSSEGSGLAEDGDYEAFAPVVTSVRTEEAGEDHGTILGRDALVVVGSGFVVPEGGQATVSFLGEHGELLGASVDVTPVSATELEVVSPDLSDLVGEAKDGELQVSVVVSITDGLSEVSSQATSEPEDDLFSEIAPVVASVSNEETDKSAGGIAGGEELEIQGSGFEVPEEGKATVSFLDAETQEVLGQVEVTPVSATEIDVDSPDLSKDLSEAKGGVLATDVQVTIEDDVGASVASELVEGDEFAFNALAITSADAATFKVGDEGSMGITAEGPGPLTLKEAGALPEGVEFTDAGEGKATLSGTPGEGTAGTYPVTITASNGSEADATQAFTLTVQDVPGAPRNVKARAAVAAAEVSWDAPASDGEAAIEKYVVKATPGGQSVEVDATETSVKVEGLTVGVAYSFNVEATNSVGTGQAGESGNVVPTSTPLQGLQAATGTGGAPVSTEPVGLTGGQTMTATGEGAGTLETGFYGSDPVTKLPTATGFFDVATATGSTFSTITFQVCGVSPSTVIEWWNPAKQAWEPVSSQTKPAGSPLCITVTADTTSSPSVTDYSGTVFATTTTTPGVPTITSVTPNTGSDSGGTPVTIKGTNFQAGATVKIAQGRTLGPEAIPATQVEVLSPTEIKAVTGGKAKPGTYRVYVIEAAGTSSATNNAYFTYNTAPTITSITPPEGTINGGTQITITGTNFTPGATVKIAQGRTLGPEAIPATSIQVISPTEIKATTGGKAKAGTFQLYVITTAGTSPATPTTDEYTYTTTPTVTSITPPEGTVNGGTPITIKGTNFAPGATVKIAQGRTLGPEAIPATSIQVISPTEITATTGGHAKPGTWHLYVIQSAGTNTPTTANNYTYR